MGSGSCFSDIWVRLFLEGWIRVHSVRIRNPGFHAWSPRVKARSSLCQKIIHPAKPVKTAILHGEGNNVWTIFCRFVINDKKNENKGSLSLLGSIKPLPASILYGQFVFVRINESPATAPPAMHDMPKHWKARE